MMQRLARRAVFVLVLGLFVTGCFPKKSTTTQAEPLPKVDQQVSFNTQWKANGGSGTGGLLMNLAPAMIEIEGQPHVISADRKGYVMATNLATGKQRWRIDTHLKLSSGVGYNDNLIVLGSHQAEVVALDKSTGAEVWRTQVSSEVLSAPMGSDEGIAVLTIDSRLHGLDPQNGKEKWLFDAMPPALKLRGGSSPLVIDGHALVGFANGQAGLFDLNSGRVVWLESIAQPRGRTEIERIVDINGQLATRGNMAYLVSYQGKLAALDLKTLQVQWTRDASSYVGLDTGPRAVVITDGNGTLQAYDRLSGELLWTQDALRHRQLTAPAVVKDTVIVADAKGKIYALSLQTGSLLGYRQFDGAGFRAPPLVSNQDLIVQTKAGRLIKFSVEPIGRS
jgi:outer membrane protein assembly factor BamB